MLIIIAQMILDVRMRGTFQFGFTQIIQMLMFLTLICTFVVSR